MPRTYGSKDKGERKSQYDISEADKAILLLRGFDPSKRLFTNTKLDEESEVVAKPRKTETRNKDQQNQMKFGNISFEKDLSNTIMENDMTSSVSNDMTRLTNGMTGSAHGRMNYFDSMRKSPVIMSSSTNSGGSVSSDHGVAVGANPPPNQPGEQNAFSNGSLGCSGAFRNTVAPVHMTSSQTTPFSAAARIMPGTIKFVVPADHPATTGGSGNLGKKRRRMPLESSASAGNRGPRLRNDLDSQKRQKLSLCEAADDDVAAPSAQLGYEDEFAATRADLALEGQVSAWSRPRVIQPMITKPPEPPRQSNLPSPLSNSPSPFGGVPRVKGSGKNENPDYRTSFHYLGVSTNGRSIQKIEKDETGTANWNKPKVSSREPTAGNGGQSLTNAMTTTIRREDHEVTPVSSAKSSPCSQEFLGRVRRADLYARSLIPSPRSSKSSSVEALYPDGCMSAQCGNTDADGVRCTEFFPLDFETPSKCTRCDVINVPQKADQEAGNGSRHKDSLPPGSWNRGLLVGLGDLFAETETGAVMRDQWKAEAGIL